jgi:NADPH:quinone reductase-like Zn-dependent oxidoreductase
VHAIHLTAFGNPIEGLHHVEIPEPGAPGAQQALIQVEYSPINMSDLLLALGIYAFRPQLPSVIGGEGVGTILAVGAGVKNVRVGDRVTIPFGTFAWAQRLLAPAEHLFVVSPRIDVKQAAMLTINPPTAVLLLDDIVHLNAGEWVVLNAANGGVGRGVIAVAKARRLKTVSIVRRKELAAELEADGSGVALVDSPELVAQVKRATGGAAIRLGLDGIAGTATDVMSKLVTSSGTVVVYAGMSGQPVTVNPGELAFKQVSIRGFFMYHPDNIPKLRAAMTEGAALMAAGRLNVPVAATYPLTAIRDAIAHVQRGGKVLLDFEAPARKA